MDAALTEFKNALQNSGLGAGLVLLNNRVPHRFTAVLRLDGAMMRTIAIVDKLGQAVPDSLKQIPIEDSFCQFALRDGSFLTQNSSDDERLEGHVYKGVLNTYVGLPLSHGDGELFGTLCHFDFPPLVLPDDEFDFLHEAAQILPPFVSS